MPGPAVLTPFLSTASLGSPTSTAPPEKLEEHMREYEEATVGAAAIVAQRRPEWGRFETLNRPTAPEPP
jgi:hypothetical protein